MSLMKLAIPFKLYYELNDVADEFNIQYNPETSTIDKLGDFIEAFPGKRVNVEIVGDMDDKKLIKSIVRLDKENIYFRLRENHIKNIESLKQMNCKYFFSYDAPAYNIVSLDYFISLGVSDVYLSDDLWYFLKDVCDLCHKNKVNVRFVANRIPSMCSTRGFDKRAMIVRPNDFDLIDGLIDTIEFDCYDFKGVYNFGMLSALYKTWFTTKNWYGDLGEINYDIKIPFPNTTMIDTLTKERIRCGMRCFKGGSCKRCTDTFDVAYSLKEKNWRISAPKRLTTDS